MATGWYASRKSNRYIYQICELGISAALQTREYKNFTKLLKNARRIENYRKNMINNFYSNKNKFEKTSKSFALNRDVQKITTQIVTSKINVSSAKSPYFNKKFEAVNKKSENWVESWFDDERNLEKFTDKDRDKLIKQNRCWFCRKSKHRKNNLICINANRKNGVQSNKTFVIFQKANESEFDTSLNSEKE